MSNRSNHMTELTRPSDHTPRSARGGTSSTCFATFINDEQLAALSKGVTPATMDRSTKWALSNLEAWKEARNQKHPEDLLPEDLVMSNDPATINLHLSRFVLETRKFSGEYYPPTTLHQLLCGILRHMRTINPGCVNFWTRKTPGLNSFREQWVRISINCTPLQLDETQSMQGPLQRRKRKSCGRVACSVRRLPTLFRIP